MVTRLSENFTLEELTKSQAAERKGINNRPAEQEIVDNLRRLCERILQPVRDHYGVPFTPSSGFRSPALNVVIGGAAASQHMRGQAADFEVPGVGNYAVACWIRDHLEFDQLMLEHYTPGEPWSGWVHCSLCAEGNRGRVLTVNRRLRLAGLQE